MQKRGQPASRRWRLPGEGGAGLQDKTSGSSAPHGPARVICRVEVCNNKTTHLYLSNHSGTRELSAGTQEIPWADLAETLWSCIFKPSDSIPHGARVKGHDAPAVDWRFRVKQQSFKHAFKVHIIWMSYVKPMLLPPKANSCLFPSQLASSLTFIMEALQLPGVDDTCRSASIKAFRFLRVIPRNISSDFLVQAHFYSCHRSAVVFSYIWSRSGIRFCPFPLELCCYLIFSGFFWVQICRHCAPAPEVYGVSVPVLVACWCSFSPPWDPHYKFYVWGVSLCMKYLVFGSLLGIKMLDCLQRRLQKQTNKKKTTEMIRLVCI